MVYLLECNVRQHILAFGFERSWQAELLAQVAKEGRRNTLRIIVIWAFAHKIHKGYMVSVELIDVPFIVADGLAGGAVPVCRSLFSPAVEVRSTLVPAWILGVVVDISDRLLSDSAD
jgi:hypothetical protein